MFYIFVTFIATGCEMYLSSADGRQQQIELECVNRKCTSTVHDCNRQRYTPRYRDQHWQLHLRITALHNNEIHRGGWKVRCDFRSLYFCPCVLGTVYYEFGYNDQIPLHQYHWQPCQKVRLQLAPSYSRQFLLRYFLVISGIQ